MRRNIRKCIAVFISFVVLFNGIEVMAVESNITAYSADSEEPVVYPETLLIDKTEVVVGDTVKISIKATDNAGIDRVTISFKNQDINHSILYKEMQYNEEKESYEYFLEINEKVPAGHWNIDRITAWDVGGNSASISYYSNKEVGMWEFSVENTMADSEEPVVYPETLLIDKTEVVVGDTVKISIKATDNVGIDRVTISFKNQDINHSILYKEMQYNEEKESYEYFLEINEKVPAGHWNIDRITAWDVGGNSASISYYSNKEVGMWEFSVENTMADSEEPVVYPETLLIDKTEVVVGDTVKISIKATDNVGIDRVTISFKNQDINHSILYKEMQYNEEKESYEYFLEINEKVPVGHWKIDRITAWDVGGNSASISYFSNKEIGMWEFIVSDNDSGLDYNCEVLNQTLESGNAQEFSYSTLGNNSFGVRILDKAIVDCVQTGIEYSTSDVGTTVTKTYQFLPGKVGTTVVEIYNISTNEIYRVYRVKVVPREYKVYVGNKAEVKILATEDQEYSAVSNLSEVVELELIDKNSVTINGKGQYEYTYLVGVEGIGKRKITLTGSIDKRKIILDMNVSEFPFKDVNEEEWYWESVVYICENEIMTGLTSDTFGPNETLTRAQFAIILYQMNGKPSIEYSAKFADIHKGQWFTDGVLWANSIGVVGGYNNGIFGPNNNITREQMALMMYNYAKYKGYDISKKEDISFYADASKVSDYAREAFEWAVGSEIIGGKAGNLLAPQGKATRAECATIMMRFMEKYTK